MAVIVRRVTPHGFKYKSGILMLQLKTRTGVALMLICTLLSACDRESASGNAPLSAGASVEGKLHLSGSSSAMPLMTEIANRFQSLHPKVEIRIDTGGSGRGISDVRDGTADIGMVSRVLTEQEQDLKGFPFARDSGGLMVHKDNPVTTLTAVQVADIFTGKIKNWNKVGGANAPIVVVNREEGRGLVDLFTHYFKIRYEDIRAQAVIGEHALASAAVASQPNAIGLVSAILAENESKAGVPVKVIALDGVAATRANILAGDYPLARPLILVTRTLPSGLAKTFIEYSLSLQVVDIVEKMGFVPYQE